MIESLEELREQAIKYVPSDRRRFRKRLGKILDRELLHLLSPKTFKEVLEMLELIGVRDTSLARISFLNESTIKKWRTKPTTVMLSRAGFIAIVAKYLAEG